MSVITDNKVNTTLIVIMKASQNPSFTMTRSKGMTKGTDTIKRIKKIVGYLDSHRDLRVHKTSEKLLDEIRHLSDAPEPEIPISI